MKSNIMKMVTMCLCMMVVGFAADSEQTIKTLKHKVSNNIQDKMDIIKYNNDRIAKIQDAAASRDTRNIQNMKLNQALSDKPNNGVVEPTENPNTNPELGERDTSVEVYFCNDYWAGESSFNIIDSDGNGLWDPSYDASWVGSYGCHSEFITLADGDYTIELYDSYGDGGICAGVYEPGVGTFADYFCAEGYGSSVSFTVGGGAAEGCTDCVGNDCTGYESWATDGYCDDGAWGIDFHCPDWNCDGGGCGTEDLGDGTCGTPAAPECAEGEFDCLGDGTECIYGSWECDNWTDCSNGSDEADCAPASCADQGLWDCGDGQCINPGYVCDGSSEFCNAGWGPDCANGADEGLEACGYADECATDPTCADTGCGYWLNYGYDCGSLSGWGYDCSICEAEGACAPAECTDDQFTCNDGSCIPGSWECDIDWCDCADCEDEADCGDTGPSEECTDCVYDFTAYGSECCDTAATEYGLSCAALEGNYGWDCSGCECPLDEDPPACETYDCVGACADNYLSWVGDGYCDDGAYGIDFVSCNDFDCDGGDCGYGYDCAGNCGGAATEDACGECEGDGSSCADCAGVPNGGNVVDCAGSCVDGGMADSYLGDGWCDDGSWGVDLTCQSCDNGDCNQSSDPDADCYVEPECSFFDCVGACADGYESWVGDGWCDGSDAPYGFDFTCLDCDAGDCAGECGCEEGIADGACDCDGNTEDDCGVCGGDNSSCADCAGVPNGDAVTDCADDDCWSGWVGDGWCDGTDQPYGADLTCHDCDGGDCMGACGCEDDTSCNDCCGVPNGDNSTCGGSGDITGGGIDVTDVVALVGAILGSDPLDECAENEGDANGDGTLSVLDVIIVVEAILAGNDDDDGAPDCLQDCEGLADMEATCFAIEDADESAACVCSWLDGLGGLNADCISDCEGEELAEVEYVADLCATLAECDEGYVPDCSGDGDCCPTSWVGDGFEDCEDQAYGCDLTCYDNDGGDCDETADTGGDTGGSEACSDCEFDFTNYGSECCDTAWDEYGINCATLEANYSWDCSGCACPGDAAGSCGDGVCNVEEDATSCPDDCSCDALGALEDCSGDGDCCPTSWVGDGFADCEDQAYGCDLTCYENDGGDCDAADDGGADDGGADDGGDDGSEGCGDGYVEDCSGDGDCCAASWIGDGFEDCEDQAYGCDLTCYDSDGGDCAAGDDGGDTGGSEACSDCEYDFTNYGSECCDTAWDAFGIDCATLEANYFWDCSGCACPGDVAGDDGGDDGGAGCAEDEFTCNDGSCIPGSWECDIDWCDCADCEDEANCGGDDGGDDGGSACAEGEFDCGDGQCIPGSYYCDGSSEFCNAGWGPDCANGADEGLETCGYADECATDPTCADTGCGYWLNYGYDCGSLSGWGYDCSICEAEGACAPPADGCADDEFTCNDGSCIPGSWECDVYWCDCADCEDEADCGGRAAESNSTNRLSKVDYKMNDLAKADMAINANSNSTKIDPISKVDKVVTKDRSLPVYNINKAVDVDTKAVVKKSSRFMIKSILKDVKNPADVIKPEASLNRSKKATNFESKLQSANSVKLLQTSEGLSYEADGYVGFEITLSHGADFEIDVTKSAFVADYKTTGNTTKVIVVNPETNKLFSSNGDFTIIDVVAGTSGGTAIEADIVSVPTTFGLSDAYPNPFNPTTSVELAMPVDGFVSVKIYNLMGQVVSTLHEGNLTANTYSFAWDAADVSSGMYFLRAETAGNVDIQKIMLMK